MAVGLKAQAGDDDDGRSGESKVGHNDPATLVITILKTVMLLLLLLMMVLMKIARLFTYIRFSSQGVSVWGCGLGVGILLSEFADLRLKATAFRPGAIECLGLGLFYLNQFRALVK